MKDFLIDMASGIAEGFSLWRDYDSAEDQFMGGANTALKLSYASSVFFDFGVAAWDEKFLTPKTMNFYSCVQFACSFYGCYKSIKINTEEAKLGAGEYNKNRFVEGYYIWKMCKAIFLIAAGMRVIQPFKKTYSFGQTCCGLLQILRLMDAKIVEEGADADGRLKEVKYHMFMEICSIIADINLLRKQPSNYALSTLTRTGVSVCILDSFYRLIARGKYCVMVHKQKESYEHLSSCDLEKIPEDQSHHQFTTHALRACPQENKNGVISFKKELSQKIDLLTAKLKNLELTCIDAERLKTVKKNLLNSDFSRRWPLFIREIGKKIEEANPSDKDCLEKIKEDLLDKYSGCPSTISSELYLPDVKRIKKEVKRDGTFDRSFIIDEFLDFLNIEKEKLIIYFTEFSRKSSMIKGKFDHSDLSVDKTFKQMNVAFLGSNVDVHDAGKIKEYTQLILFPHEMPVPKERGQFASFLGYLMGDASYFCRDPRREFEDRITNNSFGIIKSFVEEKFFSQAGETDEERFAKFESSKDLLSNFHEVLKQLKEGEFRERYNELTNWGDVIPSEEEVEKISRKLQEKYPLEKLNSCISKLESYESLSDLDKYTVHNCVRTVFMALGIIEPTKHNGYGSR